MAAVKENQVVFMKAETLEGTPVIVLGVTREAWVYMKDGKTHTFDFTTAGLPMKLVMFGAKDHAEAMKFLEDSAKAANVPILDERRKDWSI
jgi:hypothetical protein